VVTHSILMRAKSKTVRFIRTVHKPHDQDHSAPVGSAESTLYNRVGAVASDSISRLPPLC